MRPSPPLIAVDRILDVDETIPPLIAIAIAAPTAAPLPDPYLHALLRLTLNPHLTPTPARSSPCPQLPPFVGARNPAIYAGGVYAMSGL